MPVDRPTFSESWYRVAALSPRLRSTIQVHRQHYRGQTWYVLQDPTSNQFSRLNEAGYYFLGMLDGRRTVGEVWHACNEMLGDAAPTQGEAIQLLGQLYTANLLQAELPPDAEGLFERYRKRRTREVQGYLMNLLFIRIPLIDPDHFLNRWVGVFGKVFTWYGLLVWIGIISAGMYALVGNVGELFNSAQNVLEPDKLPLLYLSFALIKVFHEFGHGFACKRFGRITGTGGEVHVMGLMMLVFTPVPYVDASSAWAFRKKSHRAIVGMAGMYVELAIAAVAAMVWANTSDGTVHTICYNVMFIASVSTLLFNGNPLLRYDAYYILSDLIEIPNLSNRSRQYLYYLVRKYLWGVKRARNPAHTGGEKAWFVVYGLASTVYRVFICVRILLFIADKLFMLGLVLAVLAIVAWVLTPLFKFIRYLATSGELSRTRPRAVITTLLFFAAVGVGVGVVPVPDRFVIEGVVQPIEYEVVYAGEDGFVQDTLPSGTFVTSEAASPKAEQQLADLGKQLQAMRTQRTALQARLDAPADAPAAPAAPTSRPATARSQPDGRKQRAALAGEIAGLDKRMAAIERKADILRRSLRPLVLATNRDLETERKALAERRKAEEVRFNIALAKGDNVMQQVLTRRMKALDKRIARVEEQLKRLALRSQEASGTWIAPEIERVAGSYLRRGEQVGVVASLDRVRVLAVAGQDVPRPHADQSVEIRAKARPDDWLFGTVEAVPEAARVDLPSPALGYAAGGTIQTATDDRTGKKASERFFEIRVRPNQTGPLHAGQRVMIRYDTKPKPIALQAWRALLQLVQKRFQI